MSFIKSNEIPLVSRAAPVENVVNRDKIHILSQVAERLKSRCSSGGSYELTRTFPARSGLIIYGATLDAIK